MHVVCVVFGYDKHIRFSSLGYYRKSSRIRIRNGKKIKINNPSKYKYRIDNVPNIHIQQIDEIC